MSAPADKDDERPTDQLSDDGFAALHDERYDEAVAIAAELRIRRSSARDLYKRRSCSK